MLKFVPAAAVAFVMLGMAPQGLAACDPDDPSALGISGSTQDDPPLDLLLVDPLGRKGGLDFESKTIKKDIPCRLGYYRDAIRDHDPQGNILPTGTGPARKIDFYPELDGNYTLFLASSLSRLYTLEVGVIDRSSHVSDIALHGAASAGIIQEFHLTFSRENATSTTVTPILFDGKGQRPRDVNTFLAYAGPIEATTRLPAAQTSYDVAIFYGGTILPATFQATLNGADVRSRFHPAANGAEVVAVELNSGRNTLVLSVEGTRDDGRKATDSDRLVFLVP